MSDDISIAPEVRAALESNRHQQIVLFARISINGHSEEGRGQQKKKVQWEGKERKSWQKMMERDHGAAVRACCQGCCFIKTPKLSGQVSGEELGTRRDTCAYIPVNPSHTEIAPSKFAGLSVRLGGLGWVAGARSLKGLLPLAIKASETFT